MCHAQLAAVVVVARAANEPAKTSWVWTIIPVFVHVLRLPDSKSSVKTGVDVPLGVVAVAGALGGPALFARSRALTV